jgi:uncharacterized repeat protein (TIGR04138 family)
MNTDQPNPDFSDTPAESEKSVEQIILEDGRYRLEAFGFLHEGLAHAVKEVYGEKTGGSKTGATNHVSGQQLCLSLRELALERYGLMAPTVLRRWGIEGSIDFGNMVYLLIDHGLMRKTDEDSIEDFRNVFSFDRDFDYSDELRMST